MTEESSWRRGLTAALILGAVLIGCDKGDDKGDDKGSDKGDDKAAAAKQAQAKFKANCLTVCKRGTECRPELEKGFQKTAKGLPGGGDEDAEALNKQNYVKGKLASYDKRLGDCDKTCDKLDESAQKQKAPWVKGRMDSALDTAKKDCDPFYPDAISAVYQAAKVDLPK